MCSIASVPSPTPLVRRGSARNGLHQGVFVLDSYLLSSLTDLISFLSSIFECGICSSLSGWSCTVSAWILRCCVVHKSIGERTGTRTCDCLGHQYKNMSSSDQKTDISALPSDQVVPATIKEGLERGTWYVGAGLAAGALASIVLARGGGASRKVITAFGGGVGMGAAWTRCSMDLEDVLEK